MWTSKYFHWEEVVDSQIAARRGIDNEPPESIVPNILSCAAQADVLRGALGNPMLVSSWYRCPELNEVVGSKPTSGHIQGWCLDFTCPAFGTISEVFEFIRASGIMFDQLILECNRWVHISFDPRYRGECLVYNGKGYRLVEVKTWTR